MAGAWAEGVSVAGTSGRSVPVEGESVLALSEAVMPEVVV